MTLDELIKALVRLQEKGYGEKWCIFDETYGFSKAVYDEEEDVISIY